MLQMLIVNIFLVYNYSVRILIRAVLINVQNKLETGLESKSIDIEKCTLQLRNIYLLTLDFRVLCFNLRGTTVEKLLNML